jgi:hypothetical protein
MRKLMAAAYPAASSLAGAPYELPWPRVGATVHRAGQSGQHSPVVGLLAHRRPVVPGRMRAEYLHSHYGFLPALFPLERDGPGRVTGLPANADPMRAAGSCRAPSQGLISDQDLR